MTALHRRTFLTAAAAGLAGAAMPAGAQTASDQTARPLAGQAALVTGAARGIGRATAVELARQGADVALVDIADPKGIAALDSYPLASRADLAEAERLVREQNARALALVADVRDLSALDAAARQAIDAFGGLDIVVANAGIWVTPDRVEAFRPELWQAVLDVNLTGVMNTVQASLPGLRQRSGGRIVVISSVSARLGGSAHGVAYNASKWAVTGLMKSLAQALGEEGMRANCVAPGPTDTVLLRQGLFAATEDLPAAEEQDQAARRSNILPVGILDPQAIAEAVAFLVGPGAANVSGTTLDVNAGRSAKTSV